jgi:hypothetical protein
MKDGTDANGYIMSYSAVPVEKASCTYGDFRRTKQSEASDIVEVWLSSHRSDLSPSCHV